MGDLKLFRLGPSSVLELEGKSVVVEKTLQTLMERNLDAFLGVQFLASEYVTGKTHGGRIDTLGIDENFSPVIIEYKRSLNENVINQGLFYLDWLLDHRAEFALLAMKKLGNDVETKIDWSGTRLICIAADFTRCDEHAVSQINRNIELFRYRNFGDDLVLLDLVNATARMATDGGSLGTKPSGTTYKTVTPYLAQAPASLVDLYQALDAFLVALGDVQVNVTKLYIAYRRIKNFACVEVQPQSKKLLVFVKVDPTSVALEAGFARDVRNIGHFGTGDLELTLTSSDSLERAKPLIVKSYQAS
jgi:predicted transport protein